MADLYHTSLNSGHKAIITFLGSFFGTSIFLLLARIIGAGTGVSLQIIIARYYGAEILGNFYLAFGLAAVLSIVLSMGFPWIIAPILSRSENQRDAGQIKAFLSVARQHLAAATVLIAVPAMVVIWILPSITSDLRWALMLGIVTAPIYAVMRMHGAFANARKYFAVANLPELMLRPLFLLVFLFTAVSLSWKLDSTLLVASNLAVTIILTAWMGFMLRARAGQHKMLFDGSNGGDSSRDSLNTVDAGSSSRWRKAAFPMIFATLFVNLFADLDILIVGSILPAGQIGVFGVCIKITFIMAFAIQITHQILLRDASDAFGAGNQRQLIAVIRNANRYTVAVTLAGLIITTAFGSRILEVFGEEFTAGYGCLIGLMSAQLVRAMAGPAIQMLMISGNQRASMLAYFTCIILLLVLNLVLVPSYGYTGAAAAVIFTTVYLVVALDTIVRQKLGFSVSVISRGK